MKNSSEEKQNPSLDLINEPDFENRLSSSFRALSKTKNANITFRNSNNQEEALKDHNLFLPSINNQNDKKHIASIRGMVDSSSFMLLLHNKNIHSKHSPSEPNAKKIYDKAELARVEAIGSIKMTGVKNNIDAKINNYFEINELNNIEKFDEIPTAEIIYLLLRKEITGGNLPASSENMMKKYGKYIDSKISTNIQKAKNLINDQEAFTFEIKKIIKKLDRNKEEKEESENSKEDDDKNNASNKKNKKDSENSQIIQARENEKDSNKPSLEGNSEEELQDKEINSNKEKNGTNKNNSSAVSSNYKYPETIENQYKIYTNQFDEIIKAEKLCEKDEIKHLRESLDQKLEKLKGISRKHINKFLRQLLAQQNKHWNFNLEEGLIDSTALPSIIADPNYLQYYKQSKESENEHTIVTLLLDNSGSMRGKPITVAAMSAEILAKTLEQFGIKVEILGFTTTQWRGGLSKKKWLEDKMPKNPGRLNDLRHIIYKSADTPWRKSRKNLGAMLKEGILKENIDGEAILWACNRLSKRSESRRILMVISDGAPVDDSTIAANTSSYLDNHLKEVIHSIEQKSDIQMIAIGIGHDVTRYYSNAVTIRDVEDLGNTMFKQLTEVFTQKSSKL